MISNAKNVDDYIAEAPVERRAALERLRALCLESFKGCEECIEYGMAAYKRHGVLEIAFASQKQYIAVYGIRQAMEEFGGVQAALMDGKGCLRFKKPDQIDFDLLKKVLRRKAAVRERV
jgi:uncharacterized protein YdhG (YjbR/CyaY superfamily)